jgi:hypothetical protein
MSTNMSIVHAIVHRGQLRGHFGQFDRYSSGESSERSRRPTVWVDREPKAALRKAPPQDVVRVIRLSGGVVVVVVVVGGVIAPFCFS